MARSKKTAADTPTSTTTVTVTLVSGEQFFVSVSVGEVAQWAADIEHHGFTHRAQFGRVNRWVPPHGVRFVEWPAE